MKDDYNDLSEDEYIPRHASSDYNLNNKIKYKSNNILDNLDYNDINDYYKVDTDINIDNGIYDEDFIVNNDNEIKSNKKKKRTIKKWVWTLLISLFIVIIIFCLIKLLFWIRDNKNTSNVVNEINNITEVEEKEDNENTELVNEDSDKESDYWYYIKFPLTMLVLPFKKSI